MMDWRGRALAAAWLFLVVFLLGGSVLSATDHQSDSQPTTAEQRADGDQAVPPSRRISVESPEARANAGPAADLPPTQAQLVVSARHKTGALWFKRNTPLLFTTRSHSNALARAPPR